MKIVTLMLVLMMIFGFTATVPARVDSHDLNKANEHAAKAAKVFTEIMDAPDKGIPQQIIDEAEVIAVFPSVLKVGFVFGGRAGSGVVSMRDPQTRQWQAPIFVHLGGGSFGAQIGGQSIDLVLVGLTKSSADLFTKDRLKIGGEVAATAGPVGRNLSADTDLPTFRSGLLSYSRSRGLFVGAVIQGSVITQDKDLNAAVYGDRKIDSVRNVSEKTLSPNAQVMVFPQMLERYAATTHRRGA